MTVLYLLPWVSSIFPGSIRVVDIVINTNLNVFFTSWKKIKSFGKMFHNISTKNQFTLPLVLGILVDFYFTHEINSRILINY